MSWAFLATKGQSAALAGHEVSSGPHCLSLAIFMSWAFMATKGQSAAVAAQYMLSGQQNQLASGQHPAGHEVSSGPHCLFLAIFMSWAFVAKKAQLMKMAKNKQCGPDETSCPAGCCPEANWFCCPDNMYCAATAADCPFVAKKAQLMKMAKNKQCGPDETSCPAGCCPEANWFCCPDSMYCAALRPTGS